MKANTEYIQLMFAFFVLATYKAFRVAAKLQQEGENIPGSLLFVSIVKVEVPIILNTNLFFSIKM